MTLNAEQKTEIWHHYDTWMTGYLNADVETYDAYFDDDYHFIGSTNNEEFLNRKDTTKFFQLTGEQFAGITEIRNETKIMEAFGTSVFLTHVFDAWFLHDKEWTYYGRFRFSSVMQKKEAGWRFIYQHFSMPDLKSDEGQTIGYENITAENFELKEAIKRRTIELEVKNKELEIEAALERVRSRSLAMHKSDELNEVVAILFEKLKDLKIPFTAVGIGIFIEGSKDLDSFVCGQNEDGLVIINYRLPYFDNRIPKDLYNAIEKQLDHFVGHYSKEEKNAFYEYVIEHTAEFRHLPEDIKRMIFESETYTISMVAVKNAVFNINDFEGKHLAQSEIDIIQRFARVFDQAYTRFLDLQKAEAQAREAQIEAALERVRAGAMGMHRSDELSDVLSILFEQFDVLDIRPVDVHLDLFDLEKNTFSYRATGKTGTRVIAEQIVDIDARPEWQSLLERWQKCKPNTVEFSYYPKEVIRDLMVFFPDIWASMPPEAIMVPEEDFPDGIYDALGYCKFGFLGFHHHRKTTEEENKILMRFANEFERLYQRFLDLQRAEAQAREAQIEAALERVRSRAMAMHSSQELDEVALELRKQMGLIGQKDLEVCAIHLYENDKEYFESWSAMKAPGSEAEIVQTQARFPKKGVRIVDELMQQFARGTRDYVLVNDGEKIEEWFKVMEINAPELYASIMHAIGKGPVKNLTANWSVADFSGGALIMVTYGAPDASSRNLLRRSANVFEQAYIRFLDLQKAEAQAREAQIEVVIEKVRAKALAMHRSEEILGVAVSIRDAMVALDLQGVSAATIYLKQDNGCVRVWDITELLESEKGPYLNLDFEFRLEETDSDLWVHRIWNFKEKFCVVEMDKDDLWRCEAWLRSFDPKNADNFVRFLESGQITHLWLPTVSLERGKMNIDFVQPPPAEMEFILPKMAAVFDLAYKRFLDLQKAEAQAREAQIEAALERVRSRTMGMQRSEQLGETASLLFKQFDNLGIHVWSSGFQIWNADDISSTAWMSSAGGEVQSTGLRLPHTEDPYFINIYKARRNPDRFFVMESKGKELEDTYRYMFNIPEWKKAFGDIEASGFPIPTYQITHSVYFTHGYLMLITHESYPEYWDIFKRFGKVFDQTYTRFLDLQKAEAQAREAQIEAALEKVRSRSLAMHRADELGEVVTVVVEKLRDLDFPVNDGVALVTYVEESKDLIEWMENPGFPSALKFYQPYFDHPVLSDYWKAKNEGLDFVAPRYTAEENRSFLEHIFEYGDYKNTLQEVKDYCLAANTYSYSVAFQKNSSIFINDYSGRSLSDAEIDILKRFSKVFEQAYIRFLDLKNAEAQARESQIQLALERVRARTMAMQRSDELQDAAILLFQQVQALGVQTGSCGFNIWNKDDKTATVWMSSAEGGFQNPFVLPHTESAIYKQVYEAMKNGEMFLVKEVGGKNLKKHFDYLLTLPGIGDVIKKLRETGYAFPETMVYHFAFFSQGYLSFHLHEHHRETHDIFQRFAKVFEQTYTRFLDLQKAEAQAREAQIEAALERVRSKTMGMQRSEQLGETASLLFKQFDNLGINVWSSGFQIWNADDISSTAWMSSAGGEVQSTGLRLPHTEDPYFINIYKARRNPDRFFVMESKGKELEETYRYMFNIPEWKKAFGDIEASGFPIPTYQITHSVYFTHGYLMLITHESYPEYWDIFKRFGKVFDQTYTRFLDLQKAEAQAREAQIEAALEKVRSRSLAMHKSSELNEVVKVLFEKTSELQVPSTAVGIQTFIEGSKDMMVFVCGDVGTGIVVNQYVLPYFDHPIVHDYLNAHNKKLESFVGSYSKKEKDSFYDVVLKLPELIELPAEVKTMICNSDFYEVTIVPAERSLIAVNDFQGNPLSESQVDILKRFAKVFDQTYIRFLDLQKAEAQAREAKIEAALERVRSRSMAMHKTHELQEVVRVVAEELKNTGVILDTWGAVICTYFQDSKDVLHWTASEDPANPSIAFLLPYFKDELYDEAWGSKNRGDSYFAKVFSFDVKNAFFKHAFEHSDYRHLPDDYKKLILESENHGIAWAWAKNSAIMIPSIQGDLPSDDEKEILIRFAKVFEQSFIRFLDIQKAEAQAREAKIEAALERVRSRSMAMHSSDEFMDASDVMVNQLKELGIETLRIGIGIINKENDSTEIWSKSEIENKVKNTIVGVVPRGLHPIFDNMVDAWKEKKRFFSSERIGDEVKEYYEKLDSFLSYPKRTEFNERETMTAFFFNHGSLNVISLEPLKEEECNIMIRFAKVFGQIFQRFLDLKKAEEQTREAQIELSLERIRSHVTAMQESSDLLDIVVTMRTEFVKLGHEAHYFWHMRWLPERYDKAMTSGDGTKIGMVMTLPRHIHGDIPLVADWEKTKEPTVVLAMDVETAVDYVEKMITLGDFEQVDPQAPTLDDIRHIGGLTFIMARTTHGEIGYSLPGVVAEPPVEDVATLVRFAGVFDLAYKRFEDLQTAERQHREAQIELALERVRARSMAMYQSNELADLSLELVKQVQALGVETWFCAFNIYDEDGKGSMEWGSNGQGTFPQYPTPREGVFLHYYEAGQRGETLLVNEIGENECHAHYDYLCSLPGVGEQLLQMKDAGIPFPTSQIDHVAYFKYGYVLFITFEAAPEAHLIFKRFAQVFEQTYTRFLDLQKAEAQAREAQIEASLEKVRAHTMGMQKSEELSNVASVMFEQMKNLGGELFSFAIVLCDKHEHMVEQWHNIGNEGMMSPFYVPVDLDYIHRYRYDQWKAGAALFSIEIPGEYIARHFELMFELPSVQAAMNEAVAQGIQVQVPEWEIDYGASFKNGYLLVSSFQPFKEDHIFPRFAKVFDQAYTRFLDLQRAEAQAHEAKVEAALEKVRARTMGMRSSDELPEVANLLFTEVRALGIHAWSCGYNILADDKNSATCCMSSEGTLQTPFQLRLWGEASFDEMGDFIQSDKIMLVQELGGKALEAHYTHMKSFPDLKPTFDEIETLGLSLPTYQINHLCKFTQGFVLFITYEKVPGAHEIFKRFTNVFEQTYTRFLDLKKAEEQARKAQIENALEKVRSRSLAMQSPDELIEVAQLLREEMGALGVEELETSSIYIHDDNSGTTQCWFTIKNADDPNKAVTDQMIINLQDTWVGREMMDFYQSPAKQTSILMQGAQRIEWIRYCEEKSAIFSSTGFYGDTIPDRTYHLYKFSDGYIGAAAPGEISKESWELLRRATAVFSFAYTRFRDLQTAEASARTARRQASLDRVRADISSMRSTDDLDRITPLIWNELTSLGIPFIRCGIFIVDEKMETVTVHLSSPDGRSLATMNLAFDANELTNRAVDAWKKNAVHVQHWDKADFINYGKLMVAQGQVKDLNSYQGNVDAPESLHLHFIPFSQGLLYVGAPHLLDKEQTDLLSMLARAFAIAYARYEDFVKLEQAKADVESTLGELKATQTQLVQQEKLASLGQLTAGIAHEIKNPLNFVNNFSEVSLELIDESLEEMSRGAEARDERLLSENLEHIRSNIRKVLDHGSRANGIVTSMLMHSRGGSGRPEPTRLNDFVSEYGNLAFHGMRASKDPVNVQMHFDLDENIKEIPLIVEDFSRVVLNICNNAFDAMRSTPKPTLTIRTQLQKGSVLIQFQDNGPGIADDIKDKILQPFFTTKRGTEGTGLGLSISHDIVKAHGGTLKVESEDGKGSVFIIQIPIKPTKDENN